MAIWQKRSKRKLTGGRYQKNTDKRKRDMGREFSASTIGKHHIKIIKARGFTYKMRLKKAEYASVLDPETKKFAKVALKKVIENPANRHYARLGYVTRNSIIELENNKLARIISRPGQVGIVSAVLLNDKEAEEVRKRIKVEHKKE